MDLSTIIIILLVQGYLYEYYNLVIRIPVRAQTCDSVRENARRKTAFNKILRCGANSARLLQTNWWPSRWKQIMMRLLFLHCFISRDAFSLDLNDRMISNEVGARSIKVVSWSFVAEQRNIFCCIIFGDMLTHFLGNLIRVKFRYRVGLKRPSSRDEAPGNVA